MRHIDGGLGGWQGSNGLVFMSRLSLYVVFLKQCGYTSVQSTLKHVLKLSTPELNAQNELRRVSHPSIPNLLCACFFGLAIFTEDSDYLSSLCLWFA